MMSGHEANPVDYSKNSVNIMSSPPNVGQAFRSHTKPNDHHPYTNGSGRNSTGSIVRSFFVFVFKNNYKCPSIKKKTKQKKKRFIKIAVIYRIKMKIIMEVFVMSRNTYNRRRCHWHCQNVSKHHRMHWRGTITAIWIIRTRRL